MRKANKKTRVLGEGNPCPKCDKLMERREHAVKPKNNWYYKKWDVCLDCNHIQHYDEFKSNEWKENEEQASFFNSI